MLWGSLRESLAAVHGGGEAAVAGAGAGPGGAASRAQSFRTAGGHWGCRTSRPSPGAGCPCCCSEKPAGTRGLPASSHVCCGFGARPAERRGEAHRRLVLWGHLRGMKSGPGGAEKRPWGVGTAPRSPAGPPGCRGGSWPRYGSELRLFRRASVLLRRLWLGCALLWAAERRRRAP